jgi:hypothetical protein
MSFAEGVGSAKTDQAVSAKQMTKHEYRIQFLSLRAKSKLQRSPDCFRGEARLFNPVEKAINNSTGSFDFAQGDGFAIWGSSFRHSSFVLRHWTAFVY